MGTYSKPRKIDFEYLAKPIISQMRFENTRRRSIEDDYRQDSMKHLRAGEFHYSVIPMAETYQSEYLKRYGELLIGDDWRCPGCGTRYATGYPPLKCNVCGKISPLGQLVNDGWYKR